MRKFDFGGFLAPFPQSLAWIIKMLLSNLPTLLLFSLTILALVLLEYRVGPIGQSLSFLGDISYLSYLLHFPLQLFVVILALRFNVDHSLYYSGWAMAGFFVVLLTLSLASHRYVEIPMQRFLRKRLLPSS